MAEEDTTTTTTAEETATTTEEGKDESATTTEGGEETTTTTTTTTDEEEEFKDDDAEPDARPSSTTKKEGEGEGEDDEADLLDPKKAAGFIGKKVNEALAPVQAQVFSQTVEHEIRAELDAHPEYKKYEARIRRFVNHPNRAELIKQGLPVSTVALEAVAPYLQKIGAEKAKKANAEAATTNNGGATSQRPSTTDKKLDISKMTNKQIEELNEQVKAGRYQG